MCVILRAERDTCHDLETMHALREEKIEGLCLEGRVGVKSISHRENL